MSAAMQVNMFLMDNQPAPAPRPRSVDALPQPADRILSGTIFEIGPVTYRVCFRARDGYRVCEWNPECPEAYGDLFYMSHKDILSAMQARQLDVLDTFGEIAGNA